MAASLSPQLRLPRSSISVAPMQSLSQADATIKELRARMGEDVGLLSYLPDETVRKAPFDNKSETGGHPLPVRILFGKIEHGKSAPREVWASLHNKPGSSRPPECRFKIFSQQGKLEESITLEEAMEQASPTAAFTCLKAQHGRFDRAHLSSVMRYYFILQKLQLPSPWPINDIFIFELKSACKAARANKVENVLRSKSPEVVKVIRTQNPNSMAPLKLSKSTMPQAIQPGEMYTSSHKAVKSSRSASIRLSSAALTDHAKQETNAVVKRRSIRVASQPDHQKQGAENVRPTLAELLFGEAAEATLLPQKDLEGTAKSSSRSPTPSLVEPAHVHGSVSPEDFVASYRQNLDENDARDGRLKDNKERQIALKAELEELEEEAKILTTALRQSRAERKRLRTSLSARDLAFLQLGQELAHGGAKRMRFDDSGEE